jgi:serine kinase
MMPNKMPTTEFAYSTQCHASVSSRAINPVAINGVMATQPSHRNSNMNQEESEQSNSEQCDGPHTTEMSDSQQQTEYVLCEKIGEGGYSTVRLAYCTDRTSSEKVRMACKIVQKSAKAYGMKEFEMMKKIQHKNIIHVHDIVQSESKVYIYMELAENRDLHDYICRKGEVPEDQAKTLFQQMASAVQYLHSNNIAHRDLKCENILLTSELDVKLADFGLACSCVNRDGRRVLSETFCGSYAYAPPEILTRIPYDPKLADVWSLGVILFTMLNAALPFDYSNPRKQCKDQKLQKFKFKPHILDTVSKQAIYVVKDMLEPDTTLRLNIDEVMAHQWLTASNTLHAAETRQWAPEEWDEADTIETQVVTNNGENITSNNTRNSVNANMPQQSIGEHNNRQKHYQKNSCFGKLFHCLTKGFRRYCTIILCFGEKCCS